MNAPPLPPRRRRSGATLVSAILALTVTAICAALLLQTCLMGSTVRTRLAVRTQAFAVCQSRLEQLRARGYAALPPLGQSAFTTGSPQLEGVTTIATGPAAGTRTVTVTVSWRPAEQLSPGQVTLSTIMAARGFTP